MCGHLLGESPASCEAPALCTSTAYWSKGFKFLDPVVNTWQPSINQIFADPHFNRPGGIDVGWEERAMID
jgi:hypothetical protein